MPESDRRPFSLAREDSLRMNEKLKERNSMSTENLKTTVRDSSKS